MAPKKKEKSNVDEIKKEKIHNQPNSQINNDEKKSKISKNSKSKEILKKASKKNKDNEKTEKEKINKVKKLASKNKTKKEKIHDKEKETTKSKRGRKKKENILVGKDTIKSEIKEKKKLPEEATKIKKGRQKKSKSNCNVDLSNTAETTGSSLNKKSEKSEKKPESLNIIEKSSSDKKEEYPQKKRKIKNILISQPYPDSEKSPYFELAKKYNLNLEFNQFICIQGLTASEFRKQKINILDYTALIFTSKNAIDHFFRLCQEMRITVPDTTKYFCLNENLSYYLQKYIVYRKRKIFYGTRDISDLIGVLKKHKGEKFLFPCSDVNKKEVVKPLDDNKINYTKAIIYKTVSRDMSHLGKLDKYDMLIFFSHAGINSLFKNFPDFVQGDKIIACVGSTTKMAALERGLRVEIEAPTPEYPSIIHALDAYLKKNQNLK